MAGPFDDYIRRAREIIAQRGWMVQAVLPDDMHPPYSYTVGLSQAPFHHPEIFLVGLHPEQAGPLLNVAGNHVKGGMRFDRATLADQIIEAIRQPSGRSRAGPPSDTRALAVRSSGGRSTAYN
ncbi:DUF4262 domain-containing protein [Microvirga sp. BT325]|uniref:DUF4262 domain-containing protein n=1 Tax=Microvirga splendida TaxID=2795727 RepID=A0ABS0Y083_9HYPH|nr:DUF4262 domain-containing protein [Microvirga splendida]MBJ6125415.1 DUF4262 domain-containing protein [Microvirga splendida]